MAAHDGYFPEGSMLRRVQEQRSVGLMYGQRALGIGAISPVNFVGTLIHTRSPERPFQRLARTGRTFETIFFGTRAEADEALASVHRQHERVTGELTRDAGPFPAGTPYSAFDPDLMLWTVAVMADSAQVFYELLVGPLDGDEREGLWADYVRFAELFGMPRDAAPSSYAEFRAYWEERLADGFLTDEARYMGTAVMFEIPTTRVRRPGLALHNLLMLGSLPPPVRELYGFEWSTAKARGFRAAVAALRGSRRAMPHRMLVGENGEDFDRVARTEAARIARGRPTPGITMRAREQVTG